jgi:DNA-directed RNA polymerase subunit H (RpoH/RPB5)
MSETFSSFKSKPATRESSDNSDEGKLNPKFNLLSTSSEDKLLSKYSDEKFQNIEHIYSQDPLEKKNSLQKNGDNSNIYEYIDDETMNPPKNYYFKPNENIV